MKSRTFNFYHFFLDSVPVYLARHYWWAYLWRPAVRFFDHQFIINLILFGQYRKLMRTTLDKLPDASEDKILQLTCVYGELTPKIVEAANTSRLHITDVAPVQLDLAKSKMNGSNALLATRMNAEQLGYKDDCFSAVVLFFLLHELPKESREKVLSECMRVIPEGGVLLVTEYAPLPEKHILYRFPPTRWLLTHLEPYLGGFWRDDLGTLLNDLGQPFGKKAVTRSDDRIFSSFYRVTTFKVDTAETAH